ncbi:DivIVA domain-containing protein [Cutibacterium equinum]|uniref:Cell wall synthesis protein Wag31 n=1 Tax=Cutibacterium equinum TaxID=3016342 RepID=A0ABY7R1T9_9ACTN|nr:DivIVA domain-containing protein [Cutibacterium equinum]WCC80583.1 DivIVA domain-containing protein [Cutibacterium equinum]
MTLTLEEVRKVRFPMVKRPGEGYRAIEVDDFVDKVEAAFMTLTDENERLKAQVEALKAGDQGEQKHDQDLVNENEYLRAQIEELRSQQNDRPVFDAGQADRAKAAQQEAENRARQLEQEKASLQSEIAELRQAAQRPGQDIDPAEVARLRSENERLTAQLRDAQALASRNEAAPVAQPTTTEDGVQKIVVTTSAEASPAVVRMVELALADAERVVNEADEEANRKLHAAETKAHELTVDAQTRAERIESSARVNAEKMTSDAKSNADRINADAQNRRTELFRELEAERDTLASNVDHLRSFEAGYRDALTSHLRAQADNLEKGVFEPAELPELLKSENRVAPGGSSTPRLDALIGRGQQQN